MRRSTMYMYIPVGMRRLTMDREVKPIFPATDADIQERQTPILFNFHRKLDVGIQTIQEVQEGGDVVNRIRSVCEDVVNIPQP